MKNIPYKLKQKLLQYNNALIKANKIHEELTVEFEKYNVPYNHLVAKGEHGHPQTEALAFINNCEGNIEECISDIEEIFLYFVNLNRDN